MDTLNHSDYPERLRSSQSDILPRASRPPRSLNSATTIHLRYRNQGHRLPFSVAAELLLCRRSERCASPINGIADLKRHAAR